MRYLTILFALCTLACIAACETVPVAADPELDPVGYGQAMYERKCQTCHELKDPEQFSASALRTALKKYAARAGLLRDDRPYVERYLVENASDRP
jgi:mono/diheme cytochrome c family protein